MEGSEGPQERSPRRRGRPRRMPADVERQLIVEAATRVFATHGLQGASMDTVAAEAGVSRAAVYRSFADKDELFRTALADAYQRLAATVGLDEVAAPPAGTSEEAVRADLADRARRRLATLLRVARANPAALRFVLRAETDGSRDTAGDPAMTGPPLSGFGSEVYRSEASAMGLRMGASADLLATMTLAIVDAVAGRSVGEGDWPPEATDTFVIEYIVAALGNLPLGPLAAFDRATGLTAADPGLEVAESA